MNARKTAERKDASVIVDAETREDLIEGSEGGSGSRGDEDAKRESGERRLTTSAAYISFILSSFLFSFSRRVLISSTITLPSSDPGSPFCR